MIWRFLRQFPKFLIAGLLIVASLAILFIWQARRAGRETTARIHPVQVEDTTAKITRIESGPERLLLVDNDLYDLDTGAVIFRNWLKDMMPAKLFWEAGSKTFLAQYSKGFVRYAPDGSEKARFVQNYPFRVSDDYKSIVFSKNKDLWQADMEWQTLTDANERKLTNVEQFNDAFFAENILLCTQKTLIARAGMQVVRVNLETGEVHPARLPMLEIGKRRSPDSKWVIGIEKGQFYCYDVDKDVASASPIGRIGINDYQWLSNDKCAGIASAKEVVLYDRLKNGLTEVSPLPSPCVKIGEPSPNGRYVFCVGRGKGVLVDVEKKTAVPVVGGAGLTWISDDTFAFSREVPDSDLRGTWLQTAGENERRVFPEPYIVGQQGGEILSLKSADLIVFATTHGLSKMKLDGSDATELVKLAHPPERVLGIREWKQ